MTATGAGRARRTGQTPRLVISVSSPFRLDYVVWALRRRAHNEVDRCDGGRYHRVLCLAGEPAEVTVRQDASASTPSLIAELRCPAGPASSAAAAEARQVLERMLGLAADLDGFYRVAAGDARLNALAARFRGMRPPCFPTCSRPWSTPSPANSCPWTWASTCVAGWPAASGPPSPDR